ncbi:Dabb family protein [Muricauda sp. JGD-17]|uniref:Dabb family protein n=1 Tax=Flagellimonas ochracea TaxID=2696472 RepID=A0A964WWM2_9FLAO|nr:Dabb family protein [Allomuricauda ochracea]
MGVLCSSFSCKQNQTEKAESSIKDHESVVHTEDRLLRHVVIFKFKEDSSEQDVHDLTMAFYNLTKEIPVIKDFEWGLNDSPEDLHQGFTHCYLLTFESEEARDSIYAPHPAHKAFVESLQPHLEKVFVVDYWTNP